MSTAFPADSMGLPSVTGHTQKALRMRFKETTVGISDGKLLAVLLLGLRDQWDDHLCISFDLRDAVEISCQISLEASRLARNG